jgi:hypothetical protein
VAQAAGRTVAEIEGRHSSEIYPQDAAKFHRGRPRSHPVRRRQARDIETLEGPDGEQRWVQTDKVPYFDGDHNVIGMS